MEEEKIVIMKIAKNEGEKKEDPKKERKEKVCTRKVKKY